MYIPPEVLCLLLLKKIVQCANTSTRVCLTCDCLQRLRRGRCENIGLWRTHDSLSLLYGTICPSLLCGLTAFCIYAAYCQASSAPQISADFQTFHMFRQTISNSLQNVWNVGRLLFSIQFHFFDLISIFFRGISKHSAGLHRLA